MYKRLNRQSQRRSNTWERFKVSSVGRMAPGENQYNLDPFWKSALNES
ncbi:MAG TPA: hypothetical protein VLG74_04025 [Blastocatellia bacterium]|nr:hypothetical protein [Blastocatellia bacterium]